MAERRRLRYLFKTGGGDRFNTQPPEGGWGQDKLTLLPDYTVSTHSRPKAAGYSVCRLKRSAICFNTQPPEGGWHATGETTACGYVSTHSRLKAAGVWRPPAARG